MRDPLPITPIRKLKNGPLLLPGSKSITNRALILAAMTRQHISLRGALFSRDTRLMVAALQELGFNVETDEPAQTINIHGHGGKIPRKEATLFVGNAGTAARFLTALVCLRVGGVYHFKCDEAMTRRPMAGLIDALTAQGASFAFHGEPGCLPFTIHTQGLSGGNINVDADASSQILTALLMVAPQASRQTRINPGNVRPSYVRMTVEMMQQFGVDADAADIERHFVVNPQDYHSPQPEYIIEPDASAASYFLALPLLAQGGYPIEGLGMASLQGDVAFASVLEKLGLHIYRDHSRWEVSSAKQQCQSLEENFTHFSDTFLTLAALAPALDIPVTIKGIAHTRKQETDRLLGMAQELDKLGMGITPAIEQLQADDTLGDFTITPNRSALTERAHNARRRGDLLTISTYEDHRFAMSFGILGSYDLLKDGKPWLQISDPGCCGKTFPNFFQTLESVRAE